MLTDLGNIALWLALLIGLWGSAAAFWAGRTGRADLALSTERMSVEQCADTIARTLKQPQFAEDAESRATLDDLMMSARVRAALRLDEKTRGLGFTIDAQRGAVHLEGLVASRVELDDAQRVVSAVPGVRSVNNRLRVTAEARFPVRE